ncbi:nucleoside hydrolase [Microbacterium sp. NPDC091313]
MNTLPRPVFVDCDTGVDDALALAYLLSDPGVRIVGVGTVSGNVSAAQAAENTLALLTAAGADGVPVAVGAHDARAGAFAGGAPHVHGADGVGGTAGEPGERRPDPRDAVTLLADLATQHPGLEVLALGPLTNLAAFADAHPDLVATLGPVTVMGGAFEHRGNITPFAEANIGHDVEAAAVVLDAAWELVIVPLDATMPQRLSEADADRIAAVGGAVPRTLRAMLDFYLDFYLGVYGDRACALHDPLAAMVLADPAVETAVRRGRVRVIAAGEERGRTVLEPAADAAAAASARHVVVDAVAGPAADALIAGLARRSWPA